MGCRRFLEESRGDRANVYALAVTTSYTTLLDATGSETTQRRFTLAEFSGSQSGDWTVPHLHRDFEESFYVLDGRFLFTVGDEHHEATPGTYVLVPRGTAHMITAAEGGGRFLTLMVPGGLEEMFLELAELGPDALRDPARAAVSARYDSIPVR